MVKEKDCKSQRGLSLIEILPVLAVITTLFSFLLGAWGIAHKYTLNAIAARTYAFETLNYRANYMYFNDARLGEQENKSSYEQTGVRYHGVGFRSPEDFTAPIAPIRYLSNNSSIQTGPSSLHGRRIWDDNSFQRRQEILSESLGNLNHVWVTVGHGICINAECGGD